MLRGRGRGLCAPQPLRGAVGRIFIYCDGALSWVLWVRPLAPHSPPIWGAYRFDRLGAVIVKTYLCFCSLRGKGQVRPPSTLRATLPPLFSFPSSRSPAPPPFSRGRGGRALRGYPCGRHRSAPPPLSAYGGRSGVPLFLGPLLQLRGVAPLALPPLANYQVS